MVSLIFQPRWLPGSMLIYQRVTSINSLINIINPFLPPPSIPCQGIFFGMKLDIITFRRSEKIGQEQLSSRDEQLQSIMACVKKAIVAAGFTTTTVANNWDIQVDIMRYSQLHHIGNGFEIFGYSSGYTERYSWYNHRHFEKIEPCQTSARPFEKPMENLCEIQCWWGVWAWVRKSCRTEKIPSGKHTKKLSDNYGNSPF